MNVVFGASSFVPQQTNRYYSPGVGGYGYAAAYSRSSWVMPKCTLRGLSFQVSSYSAGSTVGVIIMKNGANTPMQLVTAGGATGWFENITDEVSFEAGDTCVIRGQAAVFATLNNFTLGQFIDGAGPFPVRYTGGSSVAWTGSTQYLSPFSSTGSLENSPAPYLQSAPAMPGVVADISFDVSTNGKSVPSSWFLNVNGQDVGAGVVVPAGVTGRFDFTDPPYPIAVGDAYCFVARASTGGGLTLNGIRHSFIVTGPDVEYFGAPGQSAGRSVPGHAGIFNPNFWREDASQSGQRVPFDMVVKGFRGLFRDTTGGEATITLQKNGADTGLVLTKPARAAGEIYSTGDPVSFAEGDRATYKFSTHTGIFQIDKLVTIVSNGSAPPPEVSPPPGDLKLSGKAPSLRFGQHVTAVAGGLVLAGETPTVEEFAGIAPQPGALVLTGGLPDLEAVGVASPQGGELKITGNRPGVFIGMVVAPEGDAFVIDGEAPLLSEQQGAFSSQASMIVRGVSLVTATRASQATVIALAEPPPPPVRASQSAVMTLGEIVPSVQASQAAVIVLGSADPCVTRRADFWLITRKDGKVFAFTSHDRDTFFQGVLYRACKSLDPTATQQSAEIGGMGNMELVGLISDDTITEADLYGGLFDDAYVEVWRASWDPSIVDSPVRLAAGWCGSLSHGDTSFKMEVLGPATKLSQHALVQTVTPGCRWVFADQKTCGVNADALAVAGQVVSVTNRARFVIDSADPGTAPQWANGLIRWIDGANAGIACEVKDVDWASGLVTLWAPPPYLPEAGDSFTLRPGCDKTPETCKAYANYLNFGGFPDLPGTDAIADTPDAKY